MFRLLSKMEFGWNWPDFNVVSVLLRTALLLMRAREVMGLSSCSLYFT
jgi:hypothetical protein